MQKLPVISRRSMKAMCFILVSLLPISAGAASLDACVNGIRKSAIASGVSPAIANKALSNVSFDEKAVRFSRSQPEYKTPIWDYIAFLVDKERIKTGKAMLRKHKKALKSVERKYGIDRYTIAALWGVESDYGNFRGDFFIPHALANISCSGRRAKFFKKELITSLLLVSNGHISLNDLQGSWAGAFGQTQFMPSTYKRLAVDHDKDGRRDLVNSVPDALASTANFLKKAGWQSNIPWGYEVRLPKGYNGPVGRKKTASLKTWAQRGVKRVDGKKLRGGTKAGLLLLAGKNGPAFLVTRNFNALYSYNVAESYALAISHLSDRLRGGGGFKTGWPTNDPGLSRAQRLKLQKLLNKNGFNIGEADGRIGPTTRAGIKKAEAHHGMPVTGRPGTKIYRSLGGR